MSSDSLFPIPEVRKPEEAAQADAGPVRVNSPDRSQVTLKSFDLESLVGGDHPVRAIWQVVEKLDLSRFYESVQARGSTAGRAATDPKLLVALWLYATSEGVAHARKLDRLCKEHDAYRWLCGGVTVNYHSLSDFRVKHADALDELMTQVLGVMLSQGLVKLERTAQDGMRVRASAGAASFRREQRLKECLEWARTQVAWVRKQADTNDPGENAREQAARERAARERQERIERALQELPKAAAAKEKADREKARVSTTDAEARVMKMGDGGFRPAYNVQLATDTHSRVIVGVDVTNAGSDMRQMSPMLDDIERRTGHVPKEHLVDGGFANLNAITAASERECVVYAPIQQPRDPEVDPHARKPTDSDAVSEWRVRMATDDAKRVYRERAATAETVNADLRTHRGLDRLVVRGLDKVKSVVLWTAITYNVLRMIELTRHAA